MVVCSLLSFISPKRAMAKPRMPNLDAAYGAAGEAAVILA